MTSPLFNNRSTSAESLQEPIASAGLPPFNGSLVLDQLYDWHRVNSGDSPCLLWAEESSQVESMTWRELGNGVDRATALIKENLDGISQSPDALFVNGSPDMTGLKKPVVVGILSSGDTITYSTFLLAMERLTHPPSNASNGQAFPLLPFLLSTRNSPAAMAHLIRTTQIKCIYVSDGPMRNLLDEALREQGDDGIPPKVLRMPTFIDLYSPGLHPSSSFDDTFSSVPLDTPAMILHSSGSTSFPKPITITHRILLEQGRSLKYGGMASKGAILAVHSSPHFHAMAIVAFAWSAAHAVVRAVSSPHKSVPPTPEYFISQIVDSGATMVYCVPSFIEAWAEDEYSVTILRKLKAVIFSGAPLSIPAGTILHSKGVNIQCSLGATEFGQASTIPGMITYIIWIVVPRPEGYEWFELSPNTDPHFDPQPEENSFELVFKQTPTHHPAVVNVHVNGVPAYATNDLVEQHPNNKALWRIKGRKDDQLMLSTGEKTNPGPLEEIITKDKHVKGAVLFGRGRLQNGVIIEPMSWADFPTGESFRDAVWPSIEQANAYAPSHSRIFKEMVLVASPLKPFSYTAKLTARRGAIVKEYEPEIEALYVAVKESSQLDIPAPTASSAHGGWSFDDTVDFIRKVVTRVMKEAKALDDNDDIFEAGCDSLEATYIRNSLLRALRESSHAAQVHKLPSNFVYQHPTIHQLGVYLTHVSGPEGAMNGRTPDPEQARIKQMDEIVYKYTRNFPTHKPSAEDPQSNGEIIFLTGSTGGLGSQLLAQLVPLPTVSKIYAFNRSSKASASSRDRQRNAFLDRGNDLSILDSDKIVYVEGDTARDDLGINQELLNEIFDEVTTIIHNAWQVDFKLLLPSFETAIHGVRNLVDLALRSPHHEPPRLLFTSSIGILRNWLPDEFPEAPVEDPSLIMSTGYGEGKWVSERILLAAASQTPLKPVIVRVGQLAGGLNGCWNVQEWFPSLVVGSQALGCVPDNEGLISWLPLHAAAAAVVDLRNAVSPVVHLVHPRPVTWSSVVEHVAHLLRLPLVPYATWLSKLQSAATRSSEEDVRHNPALRLVDFYAASNPSGFDLDRREAVGLATLATRRTLQEAPSLGPDMLPQLGQREVESWISYWGTKGLHAV